MLSRPPHATKLPDGAYAQVITQDERSGMACTYVCIIEEGKKEKNMYHKKQEEENFSCKKGKFSRFSFFIYIKHGNHEVDKRKERRFFFPQDFSFFLLSS
jgi:hypothetical protein